MPNNFFEKIVSRINVLKNRGLGAFKLKMQKFYST